VSQLQGVGAMRTHLQSNVAHEMRTPLAAVRGYARMVLEGNAGDLIPTQREYLEIAIENTNKLIHLVNWMTRVTEGSEKLTLTSVDLRELWRDCSSSHSKELANAGVRIEEKPIPAGSYSFLADKAKMQRVLQQMLRAAVQFAERGTTLKLEFSRPRRGGLALKLSGMTIGAVAEAVEFPFNGPAQDILSDMHDIISMHGGRLFVRRTPEEGWVFLFTLPAITNEMSDACAGRRSA
jgi:signal transduction histidine kinase